MNVRSYNTKDVFAFKAQLQKEISEGFKPTLAICFSDATLDFVSLTNFMIEMNIDVVGTTTCGEVYDGTCAEESCSILLLEMDRAVYKLDIAKFEFGEDKAAKLIAENAIKTFAKPAIITYASKVGANGDKLIRGFKEILKPDTQIFGGLAGDQFKNEQFTVFYNDVFETEGVVALIIDSEKIKVSGKAFSGWEALGMTHEVTKVDGNVLYELDNKSALDLFIEYFHLEKSNAVNGEKLEMIPGIYPLKVIDKKEIDYLRSPLFYDKLNKALVLAGEVQLGDKVKFCPMPDIDTVTKTVDFFKDYAQANEKVDTVIINTCAGRKMAFGPLLNKEIRDIFDIWKVPTAGLMAMGEIGNHATESVSNFHNVTCSLVSLTEIA